MAGRDSREATGRAVVIETLGTLTPWILRFRPEVW